MKKLLIGLSLGLALGIGGTAAAAQTGVVQAIFAKYNVKVDNSASGSIEVDALVVKDTVYYPIRQIAGLLQHDIHYESETRTIYLIRKASATAKVGETFTVGDVQMKVKHMSYAGFVPNKPGEHGGFFAVDGQKYAIIEFELSVPHVPNDQKWTAASFFAGIIVDGVPMLGGSPNELSMKINPQAKQTMTVFISLPEHKFAEELIFIDPLSGETAAVSLVDKSAVEQ